MHPRVFCRAAEKYFVLNNQGVNDVLDAFNIIYPYGTIGEYSWSDGDSNFGQIKHQNSLFNAALNIQTFTESVDTNNQMMLFKMQIILFLWASVSSNLIWIIYSNMKVTLQNL